MRLDHLLSRERSEGRDAGADFQVDRQAERPAEERKKPRGEALRQVSGGDAAYERRMTVALLKSVSFSGSPVGPAAWGFSSVGRAPALQAGGQRFEPANLHHHGSLAQLVRALA